MDIRTPVMAVNTGKATTISTFVHSDAQVKMGSYGSGNGLRAVEHLRAITAELQIADVRASGPVPLR